ncbi:MAG: phosphotransferase, partial [Gammaproteobacteria bacterium]|nr:phosphotransferase [Gammaproteobacteria bacterium]
MSLFPDWLVVEHLGMTLSDSEQAGLASVSDLLVESALEQPRVFVHRDYHSRNLLLTHRHNPGIIDFQDAVSGPVTYDLVSLLKDCYIQWPQDQVEQWVRGYFDLALQSGVVRDKHEDPFLRWFDLMGVQRHLKATGIFARLYRRDGKPGYLGDIPRTLSYITALADRYSELESLVALIDSRVLPALARSK